MKHLKCLTPGQMAYIKKNYKKLTAREIAGNLQIESYKVTMFCSLNDYELKPGRKIPGKIKKVLSSGDTVNLTRLATARVRPMRYY
jgi:hypothetical protein